MDYDRKRFHRISRPRRAVPGRDVAQSLKDICMQEGIDYRSYISWRKRMGYSRSRKPAAPATMVELEVMDLPSMPASAGTAKVHIEFENGLVLDRESMEVDRLTEFLDKIKPVLCLS